MIVGLLPALEWLISDPDKRFDITIGTAVLGQEPRLPPEVELILFRVAREALRNVWGHCEASRAWVTVEFRDGKTTLAVRDNGKGFDVPATMADFVAWASLGWPGCNSGLALSAAT